MKVALYGAAAIASLLMAPVASAQEASADYAQDSAWHNRQQSALAARSFRDGWRWEEGGLLWRRIKGDGSGQHPAISDSVTVHYTGSFVDGATFDSSVDRGEPATFPLGRLIPAWQMAIPLMGVGDTIEIAAPADIAYGTRGKGPIPGGVTLLFTIELLGIEGP